MTNEQAIRILEGNKNFYERIVRPYDREMVEALELAIKALEERPSGEWIECTKSGMPLTEYGRMTGEKWYGFKCSRCKYIYKGNALIESPYCQKCGAKMKKEAEND